MVSRYACRGLWKRNRLIPSRGGVLLLLRDELLPLPLPALYEYGLMFSPSSSERSNSLWRFCWVVMEDVSFTLPVAGLTLTLPPPAALLLGSSAPVPPPAPALACVALAPPSPRVPASLSLRGLDGEDAEDGCEDDP